jgi:hypothetical protein
LVVDFPQGSSVLGVVKKNGLSWVKEPVQEAFNAKPQTKIPVGTAMSRTTIIALILILATSNIMWIESASAQAISKPSIPEFSLKYVDHSYDVPTTYGIDPYTGKTIITQEGYRVQNNSVEVIIKNQAFTSYRNENGSVIWLYYRIVSKGHLKVGTLKNGIAAP